MVKMVAKNSGPFWSLVIGPPESPSVFGSARVRSGLIRSQVAPSSLVRHTCCEPAYTVCGPIVDTAIGNVQFQRSGTLPADSPE